MNADRVISKINIEMNAFNESGSREDKACAEGLRRARSIVQTEVLKNKILNENQKLLLEDLMEIKESQKDKNMLGLIWVLGQRFTTKSNIKSFTDQEILQVLQALEQEEVE